jgi:hypothetical protein
LLLLHGIRDAMMKDGVSRRDEEGSRNETIEQRNEAKDGSYV